METLVVLLYIVFGILSLILFFKVWGMCNNVRKIVDKLDEMATTASNGAYVEPQKDSAQSKYASEPQAVETARETHSAKQGGISQSELSERIRTKQILEKVQGGGKLSEEDAALLCKYPNKDYIVPLVDSYIRLYDKSSGFDASPFENIEKVLCACPRKDVIDIIYKDSEKLKSRRVQSLISACKLFDAAKVLGMCKTDIHLAVSLLDVDAPCYGKDDIKYMENIIAYIDGLPDIGRTEQDANGNEIYICPNGHKQRAKSDMSCKVCGLNMKGFNKLEAKNIETFKSKTEILENQ